MAGIFKIPSYYIHLAEISLLQQVIDSFAAVRCFPTECPECFALAIDPVSRAAA